MTFLLVLFAAAASVLWLSVYGYLLLLAALARGRPRAHVAICDWPDVALVIPTLNEEQTIGARLTDVARTDYPSEKLRVVVVDGGSVDRTVEHVRAAIDAGTRVELWGVSSQGSKMQQVNHAMERLPHALVVVSDADARLDPSCVRELVTSLIEDPQTAIIGASVRVATDLPEERLHWWGINALWWLEGEALSAAVVSGVCYAARRTALIAAGPDARAEDVHLSLRAAAQGLRVRLSRTAWATEVRVPHDTQELLRFRRRRGADYLRELRRAPVAPVPIGARVARRVRLFHFRVTPLLAMLTAGMAIALLGSPYWPWPLVAAIAFVVPPVFLVSSAHSLRADSSPWSLAWTAGRLVGLLWISLLALRTTRPPPASSGTTPARHSSTLVRQTSPARGLVSVDQQVGS